MYREGTYPDHSDSKTAGSLYHGLGWCHTRRLLRKAQGINGHVQRGDDAVPPRRSLGFVCHGRNANETVLGGGWRMNPVSINDGRASCYRTPRANGAHLVKGIGPATAASEDVSDRPITMLTLPLTQMTGETLHLLAADTTVFLSRLNSEFALLAVTSEACFRNTRIHLSSTVTLVPPPTVRVCFRAN